VVAVTDRRAEAFAVLGDRIARYWDFDLATTNALRLVLNRHRDDGTGMCWWCTRFSPCPDETDVIDAVLGQV
jgi:hypothetical protein